MDDTLRQVIERARAESGYSFKDLTVMSGKRDPFRLSTPAFHGNAAWLASLIDEHVAADDTVHLRGLHYIALTVQAARPNGQRYENTFSDWVWLSDKAAKAARWLGYVPFERIVDERNADPIIRFAPLPPEASIDVGASVPDVTVEDVLPRPEVLNFHGRQPYRLVVWGEKSSLEPVLGPLAAEYGADLYLGTGETSDTLIHRMASVAGADGRPLVVLTFTDCDPSGWQMTTSIARKLQALYESAANGGSLVSAPFSFRVFRVGLTPGQVGQYGLPSTPLSPREARRDTWLAGMGVEQTEVDALAALRPDILEGMARDAMRQFYDARLGRRVRRARAAWEDEAQAAIDAAVGDEITTLAATLTRHLAAAREASEAMELAVSGVALPPIRIPPAEELPPPSDAPLISSASPFVDATHRLVDDRAYCDVSDDVPDDA